MSDLPILIRFYGHSMFPVLQNGDMLCTRKISIDQIRKGIIICIEKDHQYVAHRIIDIRKFGTQTILVLKGDNLKQCDPVLTYEKSSLPQVVAVIRQRRKITAIDSRPWRAWLSANNLTYGILRSKAGRIIRGSRIMTHFVLRSLVMLKADNQKKFFKKF